MADVAAKIKRIPGRGFGRHVALLGGTTEFSDFLQALKLLASPGRLVDGPEIASYERAFAESVGARHGVSFSSGRVGLYGLLKCMGIGEGDEVLLQAPTHIVVPNAIRFTGARPVYVDCRFDDYNMDMADARKKITSSSRVLLLQHTFGIPADIDAAVDLARRHKLILLEDCVHALGATYYGSPVGAFGDAAFFSTEETKIISSTMGGMATTSDAALAESLKRFQASCQPPPRFLTSRYVLKLALYYLLTNPRVHRYMRAAYDAFGGRQPLPRPTTEEELLGKRPPRYEMRLSNAQALLASRQLRRLPANLSHRRKIARVYAECFESCRSALPSISSGAEPAYVRFPIWVADRDAAVKAVSPYAVLGTWFTSVLEEAASPECGDYVAGSCPRAELSARHLVNLSTHPRTTPAHAAIVAEALLPLAVRKGRSAADLLSVRP